MNMEGFLEASRVVEVSVTKLGRVPKNSEVSLRKSLLVSKTLFKAQDAAESVQNSLLSDYSSSKGSSKLLATMRRTASFEEDTAVYYSDLHSRSSHKFKHQTVSPIVLSTIHPNCDNKEKDEDVMEFISHSVISDLLSEEEEMDFSVERLPSTPTAASSESSWSPLIRFTTDVRETSPPLSPIKRQHNVAFPSLEDASLSTGVDLELEDTKRFKFSSFDYTDSSLPGFCDHLSHKNLCSAPLITYMFGKGFGVPSNPSELDWPKLEDDPNPTNNSIFSLSPSKLLPVLAY